MFRFINDKNIDIGIAVGKEPAFEFVQIDIGCKYADNLPIAADGMRPAAALF